MSDTPHKPALPRRKLTNVLAYTLAIALPLWALCYVAGDTQIVSSGLEQNPALPGLAHTQVVTHGFPFVLLLDVSAVYNPIDAAGNFGPLTASTLPHVYEWQPLALLGDFFLWLGVAGLCYWLINGLMQQLGSQRR